MVYVSQKFLFWWILILLKMNPVKYDLGEVTGVSCCIQRDFFVSETPGLHCFFECEYSTNISLAVFSLRI